MIGQTVGWFIRRQCIIDWGTFFDRFSFVFHFPFFFFLSYVFIYSHGLASHEAIELEGGLF